MTIKQQFLFEFLKQRILSGGVCPTFAEMRNYMRVTSNQAILDLLIGIEKGGYITRKKSVHRSIELTPRGQNFSVQKFGLGHIFQKHTTITTQSHSSTTAFGTAPVYVDSSLISNIIQPSTKGGNLDGSGS